MSEDMPGNSVSEAIRMSNSLSQRSVAASFASGQMPVLR